MDAVVDPDSDLEDYLHEHTKSVGTAEEEQALEQPKYYILLLGKSEAGKTSFIECVKNYACQHYDIDEIL
ncbi:hypothetical protein BGZ74_003938, partial [Mortierella antarctica]